MWQVNEEQRGRIQALAQELSKEITLPATAKEQEIFLLSWTWKEIAGRAEYCSPFTEQLRARFGEAFLDQALVEFLAFPEENPLPKTFREGSLDARCLARLAFFIATEWVAERGDDYAIGLIGERLRCLLAHIEGDPWLRDPDMERFIEYNNNGTGAYIYGLHIKECVQLLARLHDHSMTVDLIDQILRGDWDGPVTLPATSHGAAIETTRYAMAGKRLYAPFNEPETALDVPALLCAADRLDYPRFLDLYRRFPQLIFLHRFWQGPEPRGACSPAQRQVHGFVWTLAWSLIEEWNTAKLHEMRLNVLYPDLVECQGGYWLLAACERVEKLGLATLLYESSWNEAKAILQRMVRTKGLTPDENPDVIVELLRGFSEQTLKAVLPFAYTLEPLVMGALGWEDMQPVLDWIHRFRALNRQLSEQASTGKRCYAEDPEVDDEHRQALAALLANGDVVRVKTLVAMFRGMGPYCDHALTSLEALAGWNRKELEKSITRYHKMLAITAYGFVPLERGEEELLERYLLFKKVAREAAKHGATRCANTRGAVRVGLANLAQTAGFADATRLEWAMEAKISGDGAPLNRRETIGDWEMELSLNGLEPTLAIYKQGKPLKSVPAGLKKQERFLAFKDAQANLKAQVGRFRYSWKT
jgi:hypothetical protein